MGINERFMISEDYSLLPINVVAPSFATSNNCKQLMVKNTVVSLTASKCLAEENNGFVNRCMLLCNFTTYSSVKCITLNEEWFGKAWQGKNRIAAECSAQGAHGRLLSVNTMPSNLFEK